MATDRDDWRIGKDTCEGTDSTCRNEPTVFLPGIDAACDEHDPRKGESTGRKPWRKR